MGHNYTRQLHALERRGHRIICSIQPWAGWRVAFTPRRQQDSTPWVLMDDDGQLYPRVRLSGAQCHAEDRGRYSFSHAWDEAHWPNIDEAFMRSAHRIFSEDRREI